MKSIILPFFFVCGSLLANDLKFRPRMEGEPWVIAGNPDLGEIGNPNQQPVDFSIWQARDGSWQLWSCIRNTRVGGKTRLFYRWESPELTNQNWAPKGIAMLAEPAFGETEGGLQAPHVVRAGELYYLFYGDWDRICLATSRDGKNFQRVLNANGNSRLFGEAKGSNTRDPMVLKIGKLWHCYYTAFPNNQGAVYCRTSPDLKQWSASRVVAFGGQAGLGPFSSECPFVVATSPGEYFLFRTQEYGEGAITRIYHSEDPLQFGINADDHHLVGSLPVAAPEILEWNGKYYIAALLPNLQGIQMARLAWVPKRHVKGLAD